MTEQDVQDRPGFFSRMKNMFVREDELDEEPAVDVPGKEFTLRQAYRYTVTIRRQITCFEDAMAAANGLKRGEQQILNLSGTESALRQKIVDFMSGVNFAQEGTWEEIGDNIYLIVPSSAYVEVAPATPRMSAMKN